MATLVIWHGYLLGGTGSNIYSSAIVDAWVTAGHDVVLMCQDPRPERHPSIHEWQHVRRAQVLERRELQPGGIAARKEQGLGSCVMVQADIGGLLPVYLLDKYEGFLVKRFVDLDQSELDRYEDLYAGAMEGVVERFSPDGAVINHAVMGPPVLAPVLQDAGVPYVVKIHGSELEYCIAEDPRFVEPAQAGLAGAHRILVGSGHIAGRMDELLGAECSEGRVALVPPGVDLDLFTPVVDDTDARERHGALVGLLEGKAAAGAGRGPDSEHRLEAAAAQGVVGILDRLRDIADDYENRDTEQQAPELIGRIDPVASPVVCFVGKLIRQKGVHLVLGAAPRVLQRVPDAQFVIVGFGMLREGLGALVHAAANGDIDMLRTLTAEVAGLDGPPAELSHLRAWFDGLEERGELDEWLAAARTLRDHVTFVGQVDHPVLAQLWPLCRTSLVPSVSAEAFGMVSAEAAACGCPPLVAYHSGLADVADAIAGDYPEDLRHLVSFDVDGPDPIAELADRITELCLLPPDRYREIAALGRATVEREWSWHSIAERIAGEFTQTPAGPGSPVHG